MEAQQDLDGEGGERGRADKERQEVMEARRQSGTEQMLRRLCCV